MDNLPLQRHSLTYFSDPAVLQGGEHLLHTGEKTVAGKKANTYYRFDEKGLHSPLDHLFNRLLKRSADIIFSLLIIGFILSWLLPLLALLIKLDSKGPVFFVQKRNKRNGLVFRCIKLRTMIENPLADTLAANKDDNRITMVGRVLRRHHLDEITQVINVLSGDMSLIGPRPHMVSENEKFEQLLEGYSDRHHIKPGITGLSQSFGYFGSTEDIGRMEDRVMFDIMYIRNWSLAMDWQITWRTIRLMMRI